MDDAINLPDFVKDPQACNHQPSAVEAGEARLQLRGTWQFLGQNLQLREH